MNIARNNIIPAIQVEVKKEIINDKEIIVINVPKGKSKPYSTNDNKFLIRVGSTNRTATQQELLRLFQQSGMFHYDALGIDNTSIKNLNFPKLDNYFSKYQIEFEEENVETKINILKNTDILTEHGNVTIGGMLIFGTNPSKYLFQSGIKFAHFNGNEITDELIDMQNISGNLDFVIDQTIAAIKNNIANASTIKSTKRVDTNEIYSDKVFRELITNSCIHRDWSIIGAQIRIFIFFDRIEFISPGRLPNAVDIDKIKMGVSFARNPIIMKFMENLRYTDQMGRGIPMVVGEAKKLNKKVNFEEIGELFKVSLWL